MEKDPVCGMQVDPAKAAGTGEYQGKTYYFCNAVCQRKFEENPEASGGPVARTKVEIASTRRVTLATSTPFQGANGISPMPSDVTLGDGEAVEAIDLQLPASSLQR